MADEAAGKVGPLSRQGGVFLVLGALSGFGMAVAALYFIAPVDGPPPSIPFQDKIFHAVSFACLTGPGVLVLPRRYLWFWLAHMVVLGAGIEWVQGRSDLGRSADVLDFLADCVGIALAYGVGRWIRGRFEAVA
jgi:hypothetical protein